MIFFEEIHPYHHPEPCKFSTLSYTLFFLIFFFFFKLTFTVEEEENEALEAQEKKDEAEIQVNLLIVSPGER